MKIFLAANSESVVNCRKECNHKWLDNATHACMHMEITVRKYNYSVHINEHRKYVYGVVLHIRFPRVRKKI
jgi:hypothetical protein